MFGCGVEDDSHLTGLVWVDDGVMRKVVCPRCGHSCFTVCKLPCISLVNVFLHSHFVLFIELRIMLELSFKTA